MMTSDEMLSLINKQLKQLSKAHDPINLYSPIEYVLSLGGKRIRPILMMLSYQLFSEHPEKIIMSACGIETYHNYTLLHDDLMDNADLRRGHETVHKRWNANTAILSGDSMLVLAYRFITQCQDERLREVIELFTKTALEIGEGQQYDMDFENRFDVTEEEYLEMIRLKTSVLLACSLKIGAILGNASAEDADYLYKFGIMLGLAFQLQDDYLDVYGDTKVFGKAIGGDIISNKKTYMLINAYHLASEEQRKELDYWTQQENFDKQEKIKAVTSLYNYIGIDKMALDKISWYFNESKQYLDCLHVENDKKNELVAFVLRMMKRQQ
ncbi:MAG: polyprenyl synthetase family protein [Prevotella sp.]